MTLQDKNGYKFDVDNSNEIIPLDWYNAYLEFNLKIYKVDGTTYGVGEKANTAGTGFCSRALIGMWY